MHWSALKDIGSRVRAAPVLRYPRRRPPDRVVRIGDPVARIPIRDLSRLALIVVGEGGLVASYCSDLFPEGAQLVIPVIRHLPGIQMCPVCGPVPYPHRALRQVVLALRHPLQDRVRQPHHTAVGSVLVSIRLFRLSVKPHPQHPLVSVVTVDRLLRALLRSVPGTVIKNYDQYCSRPPTIKRLASRYAVLILALQMQY